MAVYFELELMRAIGYLVVNRNVDRATSSQRWPERSYFLRDDLFFGFFLIPLGLILLCRAPPG